MNEALFAELVESVRQGGAILRGEKAPSRSFEVEKPDVTEAVWDVVQPKKPRVVRDKTDE